MSYRGRWVQDLGEQKQSIVLRVGACFNCTTIAKERIGAKMSLDTHSRLKHTKAVVSTVFFDNSIPASGRTSAKCSRHCTLDPLLCIFKLSKKLCMTHTIQNNLACSSSFNDLSCVQVEQMYTVQQNVEQVVSIPMHSIPSSMCSRELMTHDNFGNSSAVFSYHFPMVFHDFNIFSSLLTTAESLGEQHVAKILCGLKLSCSEQIRHRRPAYLIPLIPKQLD